MTGVRRSWRLLVMFWLTSAVPLLIWGLWSTAKMEDRPVPTDGQPLLTTSAFSPAELPADELRRSLVIVLIGGIVMASTFALRVARDVIVPVDSIGRSLKLLAGAGTEPPHKLDPLDELANLASRLEDARERFLGQLDQHSRWQQQMEALVGERTARIRRRADQLRTINVVGQRMAALRNLDELLPFVTEELCRSFAFDNVNIFLIDNDPEVLVARAGSGSYGRIPIGGTFRVGQQGIVGWVAGAGEPLLANDVSRDPRYILVEELRETQAELAVPIRIGDQVLGVLDIESREKNAFEEADKSTAQTLADLIAVAIENARLYDQARELAISEERNRLAREMHDTLTRGLSGLTDQLELAAESIPGNIGRAQNAVNTALGLARLNFDEARRSVRNLRSESLQQRSLPDAVRLLVEQAGREHGFYFSFRHRLEGPLPEAIEACVYRTVQEAVANVARHAQASEVLIELSSEVGVVRLVIEDDGVGFDPSISPEDRPGQLGIVGMRERIQLLGGKLLIASSPGDGTRLEALVPFSG